MSASFFARDQPLTCRSAAIASVMWSNHWEKTNTTGRRLAVYPSKTPCVAQPFVQGRSVRCQCSNFRLHIGRCRGTLLQSLMARSDWGGPWFETRRCAPLLTMRPGGSTQLSVVRKLNLKATSIQVPAFRLGKAKTAIPLLPRSTVVALRFCQISRRLRAPGPLSRGTAVTAPAAP